MHLDRYSRMVTPSPSHRLTASTAANRVIPAEELRGLYKELKKGDQGTLRQILRTAPDRVHTILPGMMLMNTLTEKLCCGELYISPYGVREGYLCHKLLNAGT